MLRTRDPIVLLAATVGAVLVLASACSSSDAHNNGAPQVQPTSAVTASAVGGIQQVVISAGDDLRFTPAVIAVHPGKVELIVKNVGKGAPHNLQFPGLPTDDWIPLTSAGQSNSITFTAPAVGTYKFVCSIHEQQGQTGQLIVLPD
ncbi:MAG TPA: cupredoxin domain-containing protein [Jatrophihabitans sp.]|jgi:plastocyanin